VAYALVCVGLFLVRPAGDPGATILSDFGEVPLEVIGVALALAVVAREPRRMARLAWSLFAIALTSNLVGNLVYGGYDLGGQQPFPSIADAFYLAFYPCLFVGLLVLPTASARKELLAWRVWSNVAIVMVGGGMALVHFVLLPTISQLSGDPVGTVISLAYPVGDLALLAAIATVTARRPFAGDRAALTLFLVAVAAWFIADVVFAIQSANGSYGAGSPSDLIYLAGDLTFVLAAQASLARLHDTDRAIPGEDLTLGRFGPYAMLGLGLATLVSAAVTDDSDITALTLLTVLLTGLVMVRQLVDENQRRDVEATLRGEHAPGRRAGGAPGSSRSADGPAEPTATPRAAPGRDRGLPAHRATRHPRLPGPELLQGDQRQPGPRSRRYATRGDRAAPAGVRAGKRHGHAARRR
jgi:hypothetical protein